MGEQSVDSYSDPQRLRVFMKSLLNDIRALEKMITEEALETDVRRIGAEQELYLIDSSWSPAPGAEEVLKGLPESHFAPELGRFNLEFNLEPLIFGGDCLRRLEENFDRRLAEARSAARKSGYEVLMTGILPTIRKSDLDISNMMPRARYYALNSALKRLRGGEFELRLTGADELNIRHDSVMMEACNTSCQVHFQVSPDEFARFYNVAQVVTAPVLAAATNSPFLFGRQLWSETRIALFQQAVDTQSPGHHLREGLRRVSFGEDWVHESVLEIFKEDVTRFRVVLGIDIDEDPFEVLREGGFPRLQALSLHNSTIYRWNRPCYGLTNGRPHLRIENRALPAGPTVRDQVANAAFWFGLVAGVVDEHPDVRDAMSFSAVKTNFIAAARNGLSAQLTWLHGGPRPAQELIRDTLLPIARKGLETSKVDAEDVDRYLDVIEKRVERRRTGTRWMIESFRQMGSDMKSMEKMTALTAAMLARQLDGKPVHEWDLAQRDEAGDWIQNYHRVEQYMTTDLFTVHEDEVIDFVASVMDWKHVRHVPVEDDDHRLVGLVSYRSLLRVIARDMPRGKEAPVIVREVMTRNIVTVAPETSTLDAIDTMRRKKVACLPVVKDGRLIGIVSERDFLRVAGELLTSHLRSG